MDIIRHIASDNIGVYHIPFAPKESDSAIRRYALQHKSAAHRYGYCLLGPLKRGHESAYQHIEAQNYV